jgi:hypothetical protein
MPFRLTAQTAGTTRRHPKKTTARARARSRKSKSGVRLRKQVTPSTHRWRRQRGGAEEEDAAVDDRNFTPTEAAALQNIAKKITDPQRAVGAAESPTKLLMPIISADRIDEAVSRYLIMQKEIQRQNQIPKQEPAADSASSPTSIYAGNLARLVTELQRITQQEEAKTIKDRGKKSPDLNLLDELEIDDTTTATDDDVQPMAEVFSLIRSAVRRAKNSAGITEINNIVKRSGIAVKQQQQSGPPSGDAQSAAVGASAEQTRAVVVKEHLKKHQKKDADSKSTGYEPKSKYCNEQSCTKWAVPGEEKCRDHTVVGGKRKKQTAFLRRRGCHDARKKRRTVRRKKSSQYVLTQ